MQNIIEPFKNAMLDSIGSAPETIIGDGKLHRFKIEGKLTAWYSLHLDGVAAGAFGDWKQGVKECWKMTGTFKKLTGAEKQAFAIERQRQAEQRKAEEKTRHNAAIQKAAYIWSRSTPVINHQYLSKKRVQAHNVRSYRGSLVVPLYDEAGLLVSIQFIGDDGTKRMMKGGKAQGACCFIGDATDLTRDKPILICEGWATGASLYQEAGHFTIVAFSAGNLTAIAIQTRKRHQANEIIICGDNDESGVGQKAARSAALAIGGKYILPPTVGHDWNDSINMEVVL
ncbi:MAG: toprim domain-containing protein [Methylobacter sp.]|nr:toprim domain-containing protein [Methylobacter sp.]